MCAWMPRILPGCTIFEPAPPMEVDEGRYGSAKFRYPVSLSGSGNVKLLAPWQPGEYELRIYRGEVRMEPRFVAETKASLLAA